MNGGPSKRVRGAWARLPGQGIMGLVENYFDSENLLTPDAKN